MLVMQREQSRPLLSDDGQLQQKRDICFGVSWEPIGRNHINLTVSAPMECSWLAGWSVSNVTAFGVLLTLASD